MRLIGKPRPHIVSKILSDCPEVLEHLSIVREHIPRYKREIAWYQGCVLYALAKKFNYPGANFAEVGTAYGYSSAVQAVAAPKARIFTLNPKGWEADRAAKYLSYFTNVTVVKEKSWEYLERYNGPELDFIFIDGDHGKVAWDFSWWNWLKPNGLMLFHDYAPEDSHRPCQPVFEAIEALRVGLGRPYDVLVTDTTGVGIAGFYKENGENLPDLDTESLLWDWTKEDGWVRMNNEL